MAIPCEVLRMKYDMLTTLQKNVLLACLLGDAHIEKKGKSCRVRFDHSIKQLEYVK